MIIRCSYDRVPQDGDESGALGGGAILPHYDNVIDGKDLKEAKGAKATFTLGAEGAEGDVKRQKLEAIRAKLAKVSQLVVLHAELLLHVELLVLHTDSLGLLAHLLHLLC